jgi:DNA-directed RNA polymerase specialized sigma subunit
MVTTEAYLYTLILYIEQNPLKAKMVKNVEEYPYNSAHHFLSNEPNALLNNSWIMTQFQNDKEAIREYLHSKIDKQQLQELKTASSLVEASNIQIKPNEKALSKLLSKAKDTKERNQYVLKAYQQSYSQHLIAKVLGLAQPTVSRIVNRMNSITV